MRKLDHNGLLLCKLQAKAFEESIERINCGSKVFVNKFMHSEIVKLLDDESMLYQDKDILGCIIEEYGNDDYGAVKYSPDEIYWMGYIYRYFSYTYEMSSAEAVKIIKPRELRDVYYPYYTLDPKQAIERILEAKKMNKKYECEKVEEDDNVEEVEKIYEYHEISPEEFMRQYEIYKRIAKEDKKLH